MDIWEIEPVPIKKGKTSNFASIEDLIAVSSGQMSLEEAEKRFQGTPKTENANYAVVTSIDRETSAVTFDILDEK